MIALKRDYPVPASARATERMVGEGDNRGGAHGGH
jgi:hypothetical protein